MHVGPVLAGQFVAAVVAVVEHDHDGDRNGCAEGGGEDRAQTVRQLRPLVVGGYHDCGGIVGAWPGG
jgi:hypothetical protein